MERTMRGIAAGAIAGGGATLLMGAVMLAARRLGLTPTLPPDKIAESAVEAIAGRSPSEAEQRVVATVAHLGFGAVAGAIFGGAVSPFRQLPAAALAAIGSIYAIGIWLVSYQGWVPMLRIMPPASRDHGGRVATMGVSHVVYGSALGLMTRALRGAFSQR